MSGAPALRACNLRVQHGRGAAAFTLEVDELSLRAGQALAILGPNGAGKSTLLRSLAGLQRNSGGQIERNASGPVTMVFQRPLSFDGTVAHNVRVALIGKGIGAAEQQRRVTQALSRFGIEALSGRSAATLSFGELRRLSLARAFCIEPSVLLLDEPFEDLDAQGRQSLSSDLQHAVSDTGIALCLVTHDLGRAVMLADHIAVLLGGRIRQQGPIDELLARPTDSDTARLLGMRNLVPVRVQSIDSAGRALLEVECSGGAAAPRGPAIWAPCALPVGAAGWLGLRPERLKLGRPGQAPLDEADFLGVCRVEKRSQGAALTTLSVSWAGQQLHTYFVSGRGPLRQLAVGDQVSLFVDVADRHVMPR